MSNARLKPPPISGEFSIARARIQPSSNANAAPEPKAPESGWLASPIRTTFPSHAVSFSSLGPAKAENSFHWPSGTFESASRILGSKSYISSTLFDHRAPSSGRHTLKNDSTRALVAGTPQLNFLVTSIFGSITFLAAISNNCSSLPFSLGSSTREP